MPTHARICKVLACVALKKRRNFSALFFLLLLDLGFLFWMVGRTSGNPFLEADLAVLYLCSPAAGTLRTPGPEIVLFWEGVGGQGEEWRMSS